VPWKAGILSLFHIGSGTQSPTRDPTSRGCIRSNGTCKTCWMKHWYDIRRKQVLRISLLKSKCREYAFHTSLQVQAKKRSCWTKGSCWTLCNDATLSTRQLFFFLLEGRAKQNLRLLRKTILACACVVAIIGSTMKSTVDSKRAPAAVTQEGGSLVFFSSIKYIGCHDTPLSRLVWPPFSNLGIRSLLSLLSSRLFFAFPARGSCSTLATSVLRTMYVRYHWSTVVPARVS
jgi:hypothetical protein